MSEEKLIPATEEMTQDQWLLLLYSFLNDFPEKEWNDFSNDLIYKNRFSSLHKVVDVIKVYAESSTTVIKKDHVFYRARVYHKDPLKEFLSYVFKDNAEEKNSKDGNLHDYYNMQLAAIMMAVEKGSLRGKEIIDAYNKWQRKLFKGYSASESGAPPADKGTAGRINPERIRYLYLAEDPETAVYEVRPTIGQYVSVATFKIKDKLKVYNFAKDIKPQEEKNSGLDSFLFGMIQKKFSEPNSGDAFKYLPTQYLGEVIKQLGFDGIRFKSSLKNGGINVVLFDDKKCKSIRSDIIKVGDIELKIDNPEIYQLEGLLKGDNSANKG